MPIYVLAHRPGPAWDPDLPYAEQPGVMGHIDFMRALDERGVLLAGGPFAQASADQPVGMAIVSAADLEDASRMAVEDTSLAAGLLSLEVREWRHRMGSWPVD